MRRLYFSVVASVVGNDIITSWQDSYGYNTRQLAKRIDGKHSTPGDHDYHYLANECSADKGTLLGAAIDALEGGERKEGFAQWCTERWSDSAAIWWATCQEWTGSGTMSARDFFSMLSDTEIIFEDCETLGTLGGPLGIGCVRDVAFTSEQNDLIVSLRATPYLVDTENGLKPVTEKSWERLKAFYNDPYNVEEREDEPDVQAMNAQEI